MLTLPLEGGVIHLSTDYHISVPEGPCLIIQAGAGLGSRAAAFTHPNVLEREPTVHHFKHYRTGGGKYWTAKAGVNLYFAIPKERILLHPEPGYSYVKANINDQEVVFNVSGGSFNGWTDWLSNPVAISVNHPVRVLRKLAEAALCPKAAASQGIAVQLKPLGETDQRLFAERTARQTMLPRLAAGVTVVLAQGYDHHGAKELKIESVSARRRMLGCVSSYGRVLVKYGQVSWAATLARLSAAPVAG